MIRPLRLCGALSLVAFCSAFAQAQTTPSDDLAAILRRLETLEQQVSELRRQAGVQTAVETVARELRQRRPTYQKFKVAEPQAAGPVLPNAGDPRKMSDEEMLNPGLMKPTEVAPAPDRLALVIDGVEVRRQEIDDLVRFARSFVTGGDDAVLRHVVRNVLFPRCRAQAASSDRGAALLQRASDLRQQIVDGGKNFAEVAKASSEDRATAAEGGALPALERSTQPMALAKAAFETASGKVSPVVLSELGAHFLLIERKGKADPKDPASPLVVTARQILLAWPNASADRPAARIELVDPSLRAALPDGTQPVDRTAEFFDMKSAEADALQAKQKAIGQDAVDADGTVVPAKKGG
ncbi:MAG: peptidylprolyl isomerase [Planctomycetes bacterium]|nr:peptidylprolyl isomerase [Planctomycetota bacterium]